MVNMSNIELEYQYLLQKYLQDEETQCQGESQKCVANCCFLGVNSFRWRRHLL